MMMAMTMLKNSPHKMGNFSRAACLPRIGTFAHFGQLCHVGPSLILQDDLQLERFIQSLFGSQQKMKKYKPHNIFFHLRLNGYLCDINLYFSERLRNAMNKRPVSVGQVCRCNYDHKKLISRRFLKKLKTFAWQEYEVRRTSMELTQAVPQTDILDVTAQRSPPKPLCHAINFWRPKLPWKYWRALPRKGGETIC